MMLQFAYYFILMILT